MGAGFDAWLALSIETDDQWVALVSFLGAPAWATDAALATHAGRAAQHDLLDRQLAAWIAGRDVAALADALTAVGVPAARCFDPRSQSTHPQMMARRFYETVTHAELGVHPVPGLPFRYASVSHWLHRAAPTLGEHNADVLNASCRGRRGNAVASRGGRRHRFAPDGSMSALLQARTPAPW